MSDVLMSVADAVRDRQKRLDDPVLRLKSTTAACWPTFKRSRDGCPRAKKDVLRPMRIDT